MTMHASPENSAASVFGGESWLTVDTVYSYERTLFRPLLMEYARQPARPYVLIESTYEGEHNSTPDQIRRQAYWAMLGGGCGQFLGNNPLWHFDGPGLYPAKLTWVRALDSTGSRDMARLGALFRELPWHQLCPEENHAVVTDGYGKDATTALTARTPDGKLSVTYLPSTGIDARALTVDAAQFTGPITPRWFSPATGQFIKDQGPPLPNPCRTGASIASTRLVTTARRRTTGFLFSRSWRADGTTWSNASTYCILPGALRLQRGAVSEPGANSLMIV